MNEKEAVVMETKITIDGITINYTEVGSGSHVVMLCCGLCGFAENDYGPVMRKMDKSKFRIICPDPPGYGKSRPHNRDFTLGYIEKDAQIYLKLLDVLKIKKLSVVGWSSGGTSAQFMAIFDPDRIEKLVFWGAFIMMDDTLSRFVRIFRNPDCWSEDLQKKMVAAYGKEYWTKLLTDYGNGMQAALDSGNDLSWVTADQIECPTLIIHGQRDHILRQEQAEKFRTILADRSRLYFIPNGGHDLQLTHTDEFVKILQDFLSDPNPISDN